MTPESRARRRDGDRLDKTISKLGALTVMIQPKMLHDKSQVTASLSTKEWRFASAIDP